MANTSQTDGYLTPPAGSPAPVYDAELDAIFQRHAVGITSLPGSLVRPRWQIRPPTQPAVDVNWCSIGVKGVVNRFGPAIVHSGSDPTNPDDGQDARQWHEDVEVLASFYGPDAHGFASLFVDGCGIPQNNDQLRSYNVAFVSAGDPVAAPDFVNQQWIRRFDVTLVFRRQTQRVYQVRNLADAQINIERT